MFVKTVSCYSIMEGGGGRTGEREGFLFCCSVKVQTEPDYETGHIQFLAVK